MRLFIILVNNRQSRPYRCLCLTDPLHRRRMDSRAFHTLQHLDFLSTSTSGISRLTPHQMVIFCSLVRHSDSSGDTLHVQTHDNPTWRRPLLHIVYISSKCWGHCPFLGGSLRYGGHGRYFSPYDVIQSVQLVEVEDVLSHLRKWDGTYIEGVSQV